jgi:hypothetical protein
MESVVEPSFYSVILTVRKKRGRDFGAATTQGELPEGQPQIAQIF